METKTKNPGNDRVAINSKHSPVRPALIYRTAIGYELTMRTLYGRHYHAHYEAIADLIKPFSTVLELCCGPGTLYRRYLRFKGVSYTGFDMNARFVKKLREDGAKAEVRDLAAQEPLPVSEFVIMQASLYHFLPDSEPILKRMKAATGKALIISEPVHNLTTSRSRLLRTVSARLTDAGNGRQPYRFTEKSLDQLFANLGWEPTTTFLVAGGREKVYLFAA